MALRDVSVPEITWARALGRELVRNGDMHYFTRRIWFGEADARWLFLTPWSGAGYQLSIGQDSRVYEDTWFYNPEQGEEAWRHVLGWDGKGEPAGWFRHPRSGRRREGGDPAKEIIQW